MRKIQYILITLLAFFSYPLLADTTKKTVTVWEEDFTMNAQKTSFEQCAFSNATYVCNGPGAQLMDYYGDGNTRLLFMNVMNTASYLYANFKYDASEITDNWTLEFDYMPVLNHSMFGGQNFSHRLGITGSTAELTQGVNLSSGFYLLLNETSEDLTSVAVATYEVKLGDEAVGTFNMHLGYQYHITLECTNANTTNATLSFKITSDNNDNYEVSSSIDPTQLGSLLGFYLDDTYLDATGRANIPTTTYFDNFKITKDIEVDATPCKNPTYAITGAYNIDRIFALECETSDATIYYSESQLEIGDDGWIEYTGEVQTSATIIYAYAHSNNNDTNSEIINFETKAGTKLKLSLNSLDMVSFDDRGYGVLATFDNTYVDVIPQSPIIHYTVDNGSESQIEEGDTIFVTPGSQLKVWATADGYTKSGNMPLTTRVRPQAPELWAQDFTSLIDANKYGTDSKNLVLGSSEAFNVDTKKLYNITYFVNGSENVELKKIDSRIGLSSSTYYTLQAGTGLASTKPEVTYDDEDEEESSESSDYLAPYDGIGINGLSEGQYIIVKTIGGKTSPLFGCSEPEGMSVTNEQFYEAYSNSALINIPAGVTVKDITICSNFEPITTNSYGVAVHVSVNPLSFDDIEGAHAYVIENEKRSGLFERAEVKDVPAGTPFIFIGEANTTYDITLGTATLLPASNMLEVNDEDINVNDFQKPIYIVDTTTGDMVMAESGSTVPAGTPYILSELDAVKYYDIMFGNSDKMAIVYSEPLDFSGIEGLEAYIITGESLKDGFEWTSISDAPAETGVILKGTPGQSYGIPVGTRTERYTENKLKGSSTEDFITTDTINTVYMLSETTGELIEINKEDTPSIPAGTAYIVSRYKGFVQINTNASGSASLTASQPLTFTEIKLYPYIVTGETSVNINKQNVSEIPAGTAFYITGGAPDSTYKVPIGSATGTLSNNKLQSMDKDFAVIDTINYVYALNATTGAMERMAEDYIVPAGQAFFISEYSRKIDLGTEAIKMSASGFTTYVTEKALDFSTTELKAYRAIGESNGHILLDQIYEVPAGEPIALYGNANETYEVQVIESAPEIAFNKLQGKRDETFDVNSQDYFVYVATGTSSELVKAKPHYIVPAAQAYYISENIGVERITINQYGHKSFISTYPLDFTDCEDLNVKIVIDETPTQINLQRVRQIPANYAVIIDGQADSTYTIPVCNCTTTGYNNKLCGNNKEDYPVSSAWGYVYAMSAKTGNLIKVNPSVTIGKGKAYFESEYRGFESITTNEYGFTSYVCENPLDFTTVEGATVMIVIGETIDSVETDKTLKRLPEGEAFVLWGEPNTTYQVPVRKCDITDIYNWLEGSRTEDFPVSTYAPYWVYAMSKTQKKFIKVASNVTISAGKAYFKSKYRGFENITINSTGRSSHVSVNPLEFYEVEGLSAYIVTDESEDSIYSKNVSTVPAGTAFYVEGKPGTYKVPIGVSTELADGLKNLLRGSATEPFSVSSVGDTIVYGISADNGKFIKVGVDVTISAGKAYLVSKFTRTSAAAKPISLFERLEEDEEEVTSVNNIKENVSATGEHKFFNLAGQPVDDEYKGIVIDENGKKYYRE